MENVKIKIVAETDIPAIAERLKIFFNNKRVDLTISHKESMDEVLYILDDDGDVRHIQNTSPTLEIHDQNINGQSLHFTFDGNPKTIPYAGMRIHYEDKELIIQPLNETDVYIFEEKIIEPGRN